MNRKGFAMLLFISVVLCGYAREISEGEAMRVAENFLNKGMLKKSPFKPGQKLPETQSVEHQPYYIFNAGDNNGFVIVSGDDRAKKILGYSDKGSFDSENIPPQLSWLLGEYSAQINSLPSSAPTDPSWNESSTSRAGNEVLLETANWGQGAPYNALTPEFNGQHAPTGCIATAMAIIMKYHNWPPKGQGEHKYNISNISGEEVLDYMDYSEIEFNFDNINELNKLFRATGHSVNTVYKNELSSSVAWIIPQALIRYFSYSPDCQYIEMAHFSSPEWENMIKNEISNNRPIIYSGFSEPTTNDEILGHAWVLDGYNDDVFHFNWGWDGNANGYYNLNALNGYSSRQGMVIGISPNIDNRKVSDCWIDYGYLWREQDDNPLIFTNAGTFVYPPTFKEDVPFDFMSKTINVPVDFAGSFSLAILDSDNNIIHVFPKCMTIDKGFYSVTCGINYTWNSVTLSGSYVYDKPLPKGYKLQAVSKSNDSDEWELIIGTLEAPSSCTFENESPDISKLNFDFHNVNGKLGDVFIDEDNLIYELNSSLNNEFIKGSLCLIRFQSHDGVSNIYIDNEWKSTSNDFSLGNLQFNVLNDNYDILIDYLPNEELLYKKINVEHPGSLKDKLNSSECNKIGYLTLTGTLNSSDIDFITENCHSLISLDMYQASFVKSESFGTTLDPICLNAKSVSLPKNVSTGNIQGSELLSLRLNESTTDFNDIFYLNDNPYGIKDYSFQYIYSPFIESNIPSINLNNHLFNNSILFVPVGSKNTYLTKNGWNDFQEIIEVNSPTNGDIVYRDGCYYLILSDFAACILAPWKFSIKIADSIDYNGKRYPVKHISINAFKNRNREEIVLPNSLQTLNIAVLPSYSNYLTIGTDLSDIKNNSHDISQRARTIYAHNIKPIDFTSLGAISLFTPNIIPNISSTKAQNIYVPGKTVDRYSESNSNVREMWTYDIHKSSNAITIKPLIDDILIDNVIINGVAIIPDKNLMYNYEPSSEIDVVVEFTINGSHQMTTHYSQEFNSILPDAPLSLIEDTEAQSIKVIGQNGIIKIINHNIESEVEIFSSEGILIYKGTEKEIKGLNVGLYLVKIQGKTFKVMI